mmetsp:Transcript_135948/g.290541  ORF Transcript_135948/g.290541 Transcript_135948/m.290541 type:complete len:219 (+) Transcript_135948:79-735(+)
MLPLPESGVRSEYVSSSVRRRRRPLALSAALLLAALVVHVRIAFVAPGSDAGAHMASTGRSVPRSRAGAAISAAGILAAPMQWSPASARAQGRPAITMEVARYHLKDQYRDGWRFGSRNMWLEDQMGGNWMNVTKLREYTFPSGRLKPRVMTKLRQSDQKRAMRYIKRLRRFGMMPFHRLQAKISTDPAAMRPPMRNTRAYTPSGQLSAEDKKLADAA